MIAAFADHLLRQVVEDPKAKIVFAGRDGLGPYLMAQKLLERFPDHYPNIASDRLVYAFLTRKVVQHSSAATLQEYFKQLGITVDDNIVLADVGMYGTMLFPLKEKLSGFNFAKIEYLISRTGQANGFIDDGDANTMPVFDRISGNPAIHFLEDTFSGTIKSPEQLVATEHGLEPNTLTTTYEDLEALKREYALQSLIDYVSILESPKINLYEAKQRLNDFLQNPTQYKDLMVPHE